MGKLIDADALERNGWTMTRIVQVDANTMEYQTKKPTEFQTIGTHQWIPCSERLPAEDVDVLISYRYKEGEGDISHVHIDITSYGDMYFGGNLVYDSVTRNRVKHWRQPFAYFTSNYEVVAWMPLPEPWKGEQQ